MKISKWLWMLLFGIGAMPMMAVEGEGGSGEGENEGSGEGEGEGSGDEGDGAGSGESEGSGEGENKQKLSDTEAKLLKETMERKKQLKKAQEEKAALEARLQQFDGIDPEEVKTLLNEKKQREIKDLEDKGQWESLKKQMAEEHQKEKQTLAETLAEKETRLTALEGRIADLTIGSAFAQSNFIKDELALTPNKTRVVYGSHFDYDEEGRVVGYDKPKGSADRTPLVDGSGDPLSFEAALRKLVEADPDRDQLLRSKMKPGAGSKSSGKGAPPNTNTEGLSGKSRIAAALAKGDAIK